jgi:hypothetical protein
MQQLFQIWEDERVPERVMYCSINCAAVDQTPLFFYAASNAPEHKRETAEHGGQGCTNNAQELFAMVTRAVIDAG